MNPALPVIPRRRGASHKGDYGHVIVAAGSVGMTGAAGLAAEAAVRSGAGLVTVLCPYEAWRVLAPQLREVMARPVGPEGAREWSVAAASEVEEFVGQVASRQSRGPVGQRCPGSYVPGSDVPGSYVAGGRIVAALGPGMGRGKEPALCARRLARSLEVPLVLDADAVTALEGRMEDIAKRDESTVLTPHPGEAARLVGGFDGRDDEARLAAALKIVEATGAVVVLKGHRTVVAAPGRCERNETGNPGMATGGSGDVLTGVIAGLLGVGLGPYEAARLGVHVHGLAGDIAAEEVGELSLSAVDVLDKLPAAFRRLDSQKVEVLKGR